MKFRKKPVVIEAWQFNGEWEWEMPDWVSKEIYEIDETNDGISSFRIRTLEGVMTVGVGDWLIRGIKGEVYPCKAHIFAESYEPVTDDTREHAP